MLHDSTDAYETSILNGSELVLFLLSLFGLALLLASWKGNLVTLAALAFLYEATLVAIPFMKYPLLYGTVYDNMYHFSVAESILNTGHLPQSGPYTGFTTFHTSAVATSLLTSLPIVDSFKLLMFILPALGQLAVFWLTLHVLHDQSTRKLAILGEMIALVALRQAGPTLAAQFFAALSFALILEFGRTASTGFRRELVFTIFVITTALAMTHHSTAFIALVGLVTAGLLLGPLSVTLRTTANVRPLMLLSAFFTLGFAYIWWTFYGQFTDVIQTIASVIATENLGFQTPIGRGLGYYGPAEWLFRTLILYGQRGQTWIWTGMGVITSILYLRGRIRTKLFNADAHAAVFLYLIIYLAIWTIFLFVPYFVIGPDRFFTYAFLFAAPFMAAAMKMLYSLAKRGAARIDFRLLRFLRFTPLKAVLIFYLLPFAFVEYTSYISLGGLTAASSSYQTSQIAFLDHSAPTSAHFVGHLVIINQLQSYATRLNQSVFTRQNIVEALFHIKLGQPPTSPLSGSILVFQRVGPAGSYFEAVNAYSNDTWVNQAVAKLMQIQTVSLLYNSGEGFVAFNSDYT